MTTDTLTLTAFLLARIEEDEARAASDIDHFCDPDDNADKWITMYAKRLAAECAAKRAIVELHRERESHSYCSSCAYDTSSYGDMDPCDYPCKTLRALAAVYADHDDYRADWAL